jgi:hypothetical protein
MRPHAIALLLGLFLALGAGSAAAQDSSQAGTSLADLARQQRLKQRAAAKKPAKVFTNDDLPSHPPSPPSSGSSAQTGGDEAAKASEQPASDSAASASGPHDEAYFRGTMDKLRERLKSDKARLEEIQQALAEHRKDIPFNAVIIGQSSPSAPASDTSQKATAAEPGQSVVQKSYNNDPRWDADPEGARRAWEAEQARLHSDERSQEKKIAADEKAISDFVEQCRHENCEPGWIR